MAITAVVKASEVFVAGGQPTITYNPRENLDLEGKLQEYLETGHKLLSITGPTKCGKSVLCCNLIPLDEGVWVYGGSIQEENDVWNEVLDILNMPMQVSETEIVEDGSGNSTGTGFEVSIPSVVKVGVQGGRSSTTKTTSETSRVYSGSPRATAIKALLQHRRPLVIDDFHYIPREVQTTLVRALKNPIFRGLRVIVMAVPHRAYDTVRVESEMTGRVSHLEIPLWKPAELMGIPEKGFPELNARYPVDLMQRLAGESFGSPHLMQEFCYKLCKGNGLSSRAEKTVTISPPADLSKFFGEIAVMTQKLAFDKLARGPRQRSDRLPRTFSDGSTGDIYTAVLRAIAQTGPRPTLTYEELRQALRSVLVDTPPQAHEVGRVLTQMDRIANTQLEGQPVLEWDRENSTLYIADPFFAFFLKWGAQAG